MPRKRAPAPNKAAEKTEAPEFATQADLERAKQIAYVFQMKYGWEIKTDSAIEQLAKAIRQTEPPKWPDAKPVKLYKSRKR